MNYLKIALALGALTLAVAPSMAETRSNTTNAPGASKYAPGQIKNDQGEKNAKEYAPGQMKNETNVTEPKGASTLTPGYQHNNPSSPGSSGASSGTGGKN